MKLSKEEGEVLRLMSIGLLAREVAGRLNISTSKVNQRIVSLRKKMKANNITHAVSLAFKIGILKW